MKLRTFIIIAAVGVLVTSGLIHLKAVKAETPIVFPSFLLVQSQTDFGENFGKDFGEDFAVSSGKLLAVRADGSQAEFHQMEDPRHPSQGNYYFSKNILDFATGKRTTQLQQLQPPLFMMTASIRSASSPLQPVRVSRTAVFSAMQ